ncbi:hypothetical protein R83H12_02864 [Fibrobacteria bacterium R8-3-H12]
MGYGYLSYPDVSVIDLSTYEVTKEDLSASMFSAAIKAGWKFTGKGKGFFLEPYVGYVVVVGGELKDSNGRKYTTELGVSGLGYGINLGWAF